MFTSNLLVIVRELVHESLLVTSIRWCDQCDINGRPLCQLPPILKLILIYKSKGAISFDQYVFIYVRQYIFTCPPNNYECSHICDLYSIVFKFSESDNLICSKWEILQGSCQKRFSGFFPLRGFPPPPPTPLTENHFAKKPLAERGGTPPPFNGKLPKIFLKKWVKRGQNRRFLAKNSCFLADFFLNGIGGYSPPLNGKNLLSSF